MLIESDARRDITQGISIEKEITGFEQRERIKGKIVMDCPEYNEIRKQLVKIICHINSVSNPDGKGRDDLDIEILKSAENILRKISNTQSKVVRLMANKIKSSFMDIRLLLRKYDENIEVVDPQLKNNQDLVKALVNFETSWEKGKEYFLNKKKCQQIIHFSQIVENACEKYKELNTKIEEVDTEIFIIIPCLLVLNALDGEDKQICSSYFPPIDIKDDSEGIHYKELSKLYIKMKETSFDSYKLYNLIEETFIDKTPSADEIKKIGILEEDLTNLIHGIKRTAMSIQRYNPTEWNDLLSTVITK